MFMTKMPMEATEYIKNELNKFIVQFSHTRVRYEYDIEAQLHYIEIVPNEVYRFDKLYIAWENQITDIFIEKFPDQNICFISDDALVGLDKTDFQLTGNDFISSYSVNKESSLLWDEKLVLNIQNNNMNIEEVIIAEPQNQYYSGSKSFINAMGNNLIINNIKQVNYLHGDNYSFAA